MNDITTEQAKLITDLESYKTVTGAKRFKRTKEEMAAGFTPGEALRKRLMEARGEAAPLLGSGDPHAVGGRTDAPSSRKSNITIQVRAAPKTDPDYFEHVPNKSLEIVLDSKWYAWFDTLAQGPFAGDTQKLLQFILDHGIGEVLSKFHFSADIEEYEQHGRYREMAPNRT